MHSCVCSAEKAGNDEEEVDKTIELDDTTRTVRPTCFIGCHDIPRDHFQHLATQ